MEPVSPPDLRLLPLTVAAWVTAWWAVTQPAGPLFIGLGPVALIALGLSIVRHRWAWVAVPVVAAVGAVLLVTGAHQEVRAGDPITAAAAEGASVTVVGRVSADPQRLASTFPARPGAQRWLLRIVARQVVRHGVPAASRAELVVLADPAWSRVSVGEIVRSTGRLAATEAGERPQGVLKVRGPPVVVDAGSWPWRVAERLRAGLRAACAGLPRDAGGLLPGLVVGDTSNLPDDLREDLQTAGLTHLTAVSGANVTITAGAVVAVLALAGVGRRGRVAGTLLAIVGFVVLARPEPSVVRAAAMGAVTVTGLLLSRRGVGVPALLSAATALLLWDPWLARSFGFALSVLATGALLLLAPAWLRRRDRRLAEVGRAESRWRTAVFAALSVPLAAQLVTAPVTVLINPTISLVSVPANVLAEPAVAPATVFGVLTALVAPVWPWGAQGPAWCGGLATWWITVVARRAADLPGAALPWPEGVGGLLLLVTLTVVGLVVAARSRRPLRSGLTWATGVVVVVAVTHGGLPVPGTDRLRPGVPDDWLVVQCAVGQGSATLLRSGAHRAVVVDAGPDPDLMDGCLRRAGVRVLDLVVLTHFHADHVGGLAGALRGRGRPPVLVSPLPLPAGQARSVRRLLGDRAPVAVTAPMSGTAGERGRSVTWSVRTPDPTPAGALAAQTSRAEPDGAVVNNASVVVQAVVGGVRVTALGDVEPEAQRELLRTGVGPAEVVVVAHHGSANQTEDLYRALGARIALIGVGAGNDYGHPSPKALAMLARARLVVGRTDTQGDLSVTAAAGSLRLVASA
ncbi:ComEC/Rec2 family competence protein [Spongisporangium articulatum]|uniref:ComEC/Rec2 family competence protein n=1 Tax=Spongisporangium articulatum TaxID=3362603 RepID=A0ABW8AL45_9ACTN